MKKNILLLVLCFAAVVTIIILKIGDAGGTHARKASAKSHVTVAVPDTTLPSSVKSDSVAYGGNAAQLLPDSLLVEKDRRPAYEAGYEDGYLAGLDDGAASAPQASYDETSTFPTAAERSRYAEGYREGYAEGFENGKAGKQFNIAKELQTDI